MPDPVIQEAPPKVVVPPVTAKGFEDPGFLQAMDKAFRDRQESEQPGSAQPAAPVATRPLPTPAPASSEPAPEPDEEKIPATPRKAAEWREFHTAKKQIEKELAEAKERLNSFNGFDPKEYDLLKTERQKLQDKLDSVALERSDHFQANFNSELDKARQLVKSALGDKADKAIKILDMPDSEWRTEQLETIAEGLSTWKLGLLQKAAADIDKLQFEKSKILEKSVENWKKLQDAQKQEKETERTRLASIFDDTIKSLRDPKDGFAAYHERDGQSEWNAGIKDKINLAKAIYQGEVTPQERARYAALAASVPNLLTALAAVSQDNTKMKEELTKLRGSEPGLEQSGQQATTTPDELKGLNYGDAVAKMLQKAGALR